jgi:hypothetical protein
MLNSPSQANERRSWFLTVELVSSSTRTFILHFSRLQDIQLPLHLKEWGIFKDLVRSYLPSNQPGWTIVDPAENGYFVGTFSVKTESDSEAVYCLYSVSLIALLRLQEHRWPCEIQREGHAAAGAPF